MVNHLRRNGTRCAVALAMVGLIAAGPVQAVEADQVVATDTLAQDVMSFDDVSEVVADLVEPVELEPSFVHVADGEASYYGRELAGNRTASGERFNPQALTAAHRTLPMGTNVLVTNLANGKSEIVSINDRGPYIKGRIIDVTIGSAERLGFVKRGVAAVKVEVLGKVKSDN